MLLGQTGGLQYAGEHFGLHLRGNGLCDLLTHLLLYCFRDSGADGVFLRVDGGGDLLAGDLFRLCHNAFRIKSCDHAVQRVGVVADGQCGNGDAGFLQALVGLQLGVGGVQQGVEHCLGACIQLGAVAVQCGQTVGQLANTAGQLPGAAQQGTQSIIQLVGAIHQLRHGVSQFADVPGQVVQCAIVQLVVIHVIE